MTLLEPDSPLSDRLALSEEEVASWTLHDRVGRVSELIAESFSIYHFACDRLVYADGKELAATVVLFSGGNDSTALTHLFRDEATHAGHANTTIGIERTRQFVRDNCAAWNLPLIERSAPREEDRYRALVLAQGFPGPGHHYKMFQRLKERALRQIRRELISNGRRQRIVFLAGRRRTESNRRANVPELERESTVVWVSPLVNWTKADLNTYRQMYDVPRNEVADLIHMSGECLCGAFAHDGERDELVAWFPGDFSVIEALEAAIKDRTDIPDYRKTWGWGGDRELLKAVKRERARSGRLCSSCDVRFQDALDKAQP